MNTKSGFVNGAQENIKEPTNVIWFPNASAEIAKENFYYEQMRQFRLKQKIARENLRIRQTITAGFLGLGIALIILIVVVVASVGM